jgi:hypothetical protein
MDIFETCIQLYPPVAGAQGTTLYIHTFPAHRAHKHFLNYPTKTINIPGIILANVELDPKIIGSVPLGPYYAVKTF